MTSYNVRWKKSAIKELKKLDKPLISSIISKVGDLSVNPFPPNSQKLKGTKYIYRIRLKDYRIIYTVFKNVMIIEIIHVGHRKDIYKRFKRTKK